ncbi:MAG: Ig-like domain-containing protein [Myxococcaceae bacterium]|nr:Ig-like domain-containing protein [Myxococcaceae bacterium]
MIAHGTPEALPSPDSFPDQKVVTAQTTSLGTFWITSPLKPAVSEIKLTPEAVQLMVGQTAQFEASVTDPAGNPLPDAEVIWTIVPARVATVSNGLVEALAPGTATLTAQAGDAVKTATVRVVGTTAGPTAFVHENPLPTGNDLFGGAVAPDGTALFVGGNATVISRSTAGAFTRLFSTPMITLRAIAGGLPGTVVAVGTSGNSGVLAELSDPDVPPSVRVFNTVQPTSLWYDGTHGMAVGYGNDVLVRRDGDWVTAYSPSFETLTDVKGDGQGGFVTVGNRGSIYIFDPGTQTWDSLYDTQLNVQLVDAVLSDATGSEGWAIGANKLWHFRNNGWTAINLPATPAVDALTAVGIVDGKVVVGARAALSPFLFVYTPDVTGNNGTWTDAPLRQRQLVRDIFGAGSTGYAVGDLGSIWKYEAGTFTELSSGFYGDVADVYATSTAQVAVQNECSSDDCAIKVGKVMIRNSQGVWEELGFQPFSGPLYSVTARSASDVFAGGEGTIWHYDGSSWLPQFVSSAPIYDLAVCGAEVIAVSGGGSWFRGVGPQLSPGSPQLLSVTDLHAIHCPSANEIWIGGDSVLLRNARTITDPDVNHADYRAVWSPGANEVYAFGEARYGVYWDTANLNVIDAPGGVLPETITGLWGSSVDNLYAVAWTVNPMPFGYGLRFNGAQWSVIDTGAQRRPTSVSGYSATDVFITTEGGGILRGQ